MDDSRPRSRLPRPPGFVDPPPPPPRYPAVAGSSSASFLPQSGAAGPPNIHFNLSQQNPTSFPPRASSSSDFINDRPPPPGPSSYGYTAPQRSAPLPPKIRKTRGRADGRKPTFIEKLFKVLEEPAARPLMRWDPSGHHILIERPSELMTYFKRRNVFQQQLFSSFTRQLNIYGFMKRFTYEQAFPDVPPLPDGVNLQIWSHQYLTRDSTDEEITNFKRRVPESPAVDGSELDYPLDLRQDPYAYDPVNRPYHNPPPIVETSFDQSDPRYNPRVEPELRRVVAALPVRERWNQDPRGGKSAGDGRRFGIDPVWVEDGQMRMETERTTAERWSSVGERRDSSFSTRPSTQEQYLEHRQPPPPTPTRLRYQPSAPQLRETFQSQGRRLSYEPRSNFNEDPLSPPGSAHHRHPLQPAFQQHSPPYQNQQLRHQHSFSSTSTTHSSSTNEGYPTPLLAPKPLRPLDYKLEDQLYWQTSDYISLDIDSSNPPTFLLPPHKQPTPVPYTVPVASRQTSHHVHPARFAYQAPPPPQHFEEDTYDSEGGREHVGLVYAGEDMVVGEGQYASVVGTTGEDLDGFVAIPSLPPLPSLEEGRYSEGGEDQQYPVASSSSRLYCQESRGE